MTCVYASLDETMGPGALERDRDFATFRSEKIGSQLVGLVSATE